METKDEKLDLVTVLNYLDDRCRGVPDIKYIRDKISKIKNFVEQCNVVEMREAFDE